MNDRVINIFKMQRSNQMLKQNGSYLVYLLCLFLVMPLKLGAAKIIREFSGDRSVTTAEFEVQAPWLLDWRVNSNYKESMGLEISLVDAETGFLVGRIFKTKYAGNGIKLFDSSGRYRLRVSSTLTTWNFKVKELSKDEAELYSPKSQ